MLADSPDGCTRAERRGFGPAVLNHLLLNRLAIAHVAWEATSAIGGAGGDMLGLSFSS